MAATAPGATGNRVVGVSALLACAAIGLAVAGLLLIAGARGLVLAVAVVSLAGGILLFDRVRSDPLPSSAPPKHRALPPPSLASLRHAFTGQFTSGERWLRMADSMAARGNTADAAGVLIAAVKQHPRDYSLWIGLGNMLTDHGSGLNPGARLAFERAVELAPDYPAPRFFYGLAKARSGDPQGALADFRAVLAGAPANASWRPLVENQIRTTEAVPAAR